MFKRLIMKIFILVKKSLAKTKKLSMIYQEMIICMIQIDK